MRRIPALLITIAALVALVMVARTTPSAGTPIFSQRQPPWMPSASTRFDSPTTWFCPGVPADGRGRGGDVLVVNRSERELKGRLSLLAPDADRSIDRAITVAPWERMTIDVDEELSAPYVSAVVELDSAGGLVEQRAVDRDGDAVAPCMTRTSPSWYFADGFTMEESVDELVLTNPYNDDAVVDLTIATADGEREPSEYQGYPVEGRSVVVIDLAELGARSEQHLAVSVSASRGRVIAGRSQQYEGGGRGGYTITLGAPSLRDQWYFASGAKRDDLTETFRLYNPSDDDVEVNAVYLGVATDPQAGFTGFDDKPINVPANSVVEYEGGALKGLPDGRHALVFSTTEGEFVVERVLTEDINGHDITSVSLGAPPRPDGYVPNQWFVPTAPAEAAEDALTVLNLDGNEAVITVQYLSPDGLRDVPGLDDITVKPNGLAAIDLTERPAFGQGLVVTSTTRILVERSIPRDGPVGGRNTAWPLPAD